MQLRTAFRVGLMLCFAGMLVSALGVRLVKSVLPVHNIDTGLNYATIQEAIDAPETLEDHTIKVDSGTYQENVVVFKYGLKIIGQDPASTVIDGNGMGEVIYSTTDNIRISGFTIRNGVTGVYLSYANNNIFTGNTITANSDYGIYLDNSANNAFVENNITQNWRAILLWYSSTNKVYHNNLINNYIQVDSSESINLWDNGYPSGGNYWSDYDGIDGNGDGIGDTAYIIDADNKDNYPLKSNWIPPDIAVTDVRNSKTIVGQGLTLRINVTAINQGNKIESFDLAAYANDFLIGTQSVTLSGGNSAIKVFTWNTTGFSKGNYATKGVAVPMSGETDQADNTYLDGTVTVAMIGDINIDGRVNILDLATIGIAYGSYPGHPQWNPNADVNDSGFIDITDLAICARNYGKIDP